MGGGGSSWILKFPKLIVIKGWSIIYRVGWRKGTRAMKSECGPSKYFSTFIRSYDTRKNFITKLAFSPSFPTFPRAVRTVLVLSHPRGFRSFRFPRSTRSSMEIRRRFDWILFVTLGNHFARSSIYIFPYINIDRLREEYRFFLTRRKK